MMCVRPPGSRHQQKNRLLLCSSGRLPRDEWAIRDGVPAPRGRRDARARLLRIDAGMPGPSPQRPTARLRRPPARGGRTHSRETGPPDETANRTDALRPESNCDVAASVALLYVAALLCYAAITSLSPHIHSFAARVPLEPQIFSAGNTEARGGRAGGICLNELLVGLLAPRDFIRPMNSRRNPIRLSSRTVFYPGPHPVTIRAGAPVSPYTLVLRILFVSRLG